MQNIFRHGVIIFGPWLVQTCCLLCLCSRVVRSGVVSKDELIRFMKVELLGLVFAFAGIGLSCIKIWMGVPRGREKPACAGPWRLRHGSAFGLVERFPGAAPAGLPLAIFFRPLRGFWFRRSSRVGGRRDSLVKGIAGIWLYGVGQRGRVVRLRTGCRLALPHLEAVPFPARLGSPGSTHAALFRSPPSRPMPGLLDRTLFAYLRRTHTEHVRMKLVISFILMCGATGFAQENLRGLLAERSIGEWRPELGETVAKAVGRLSEIYKLRYQEPLPLFVAAGLEKELIKQVPASADPVAATPTTGAPSVWSSLKALASMSQAALAFRDEEVLLFAKGDRPRVEVFGPVNAGIVRDPGAVQVALIAPPKPADVDRIVAERTSYRDVAGESAAKIAAMLLDAGTYAWEGDASGTEPKYLARVVFIRGSASVMIDFSDASSIRVTRKEIGRPATFVFTARLRALIPAVRDLFRDRFPDDKVLDGGWWGEK